MIKGSKGSDVQISSIFGPRILIISQIVKYCHNVSGVSAGHPAAHTHSHAGE